MEPNIRQPKMSQSNKVSASKVQTGGDAPGSTRKHQTSSRGVTASNKSVTADSMSQYAKREGYSAKSEYHRQMSDKGLYENDGSRGPFSRLEGVESPPHINQDARLGSSGSTKSDSSRRTDRMDSAGRPDSSGYISGASLASTPDRPSSALARGVKITEYQENRVNPEPVVLEDTDLLLEDHLSTRKLRALTGQDNLEQVQYLELKVDTRETSLGNFGAHLPQLSQLKLSNSIITSIRDLGSSLHNVSVLWMQRCGLEDLDGLSSMNNLRELYLAYNEVYDISPCSMLEHIKILDLEGNNIDELSQIEFLALCGTLTHLTLEGNPVCTTPSPDEASLDYDYRQAVKRIVPHLENLDDTPLVSGESGKSGCVFEDDWRLIEELMEEGSMVPADDEFEAAVAAVSGYRTGTSVRPTTGYRPGSALKQQISRPLTKDGRLSTAQGRPSFSMGRPGSSLGRPGSSLGRPGSSPGRPGSSLGRPSSARPGSSGGRPGSAADDEDDQEDASDLTFGGVVCGSPSKALRSRARARVSTPDTPEHKEKLLAQLREKTADNVYDTSSLEEDPQFRGLISEVNAWKKEHQKTREQIEAERAPQVLKIDHDDAVSLSGDDESLESDSDDELSSGYHSTRSHQLQTDFSSSVSLNNSFQESPTSSASYRRRRLQHDESFEAREEGSPAGSSADLRGVSDRLLPQPSSPLRAMERIRFDPKPPSQLKSVDRPSPAIRSPESPTKTPPGALKPAGLSSRMKKTNITNAALLPSKPLNFK